MGRRKVVSLFVSNISQDFCKIDLPADPGMEKVSQEEVNFDNLSEYSSAFPRYSYFIKGVDNTRAPSRLRISAFTQNFWVFSFYKADFWQTLSVTRENGSN